MKNNFFLVLILTVSLVFLSDRSLYAQLDDFDFSQNVIPITQFYKGGPSKDGIPSIDSPKFVKADDVQFLNEDDLVLGLSIDGENRAYPIKILNWHEIVNDTVADKPVAVTWCPLTSSGVVFDRKVGNETLQFGVSGLLYNSNVVMYDRSYDGLWSQLKTAGLTGKYADENLRIVPSVVTTWKEWMDMHPKTVVLSNKTGYWRSYGLDPYKEYHNGNEIMFPLRSNDKRLDAKELVLGIKINDTAKAYSLKKIQSLTEPLVDSIEEQKIIVHPSRGKTAYITNQKGEILPATIMYWFAWSSFNKYTLVY